MGITKRKLKKIIREKFAREDFRDVYATAQMAHVGQTRRSGEDYFSHPSEVRNIVSRYYPQDRVSELSALLHDSLEDAPGSTVDSPEEMEEFIRGSISDPASGDEVIRVVKALTHEKGGDYQSYVVKLINDQPALRVKLADMVHNLSSSPSPKQKMKYKLAISALGAQTGGSAPSGISQKHWRDLHTLTESVSMKITKNQLRRIIKEEKAKLLKEAPAGQYDRMLYEKFKEAIKEIVYEVAIDEGFVEPGGMNITAEAVQAASAALADAAREFSKEQGVMG